MVEEPITIKSTDEVSIDTNKLICYVYELDLANIKKKAIIEIVKNKFDLVLTKQDIKDIIKAFDMPEYLKYLYSEQHI